MKTRLKPWEPREHQKCYCAAVATAVAGVAAAGTAAYSASQQGKAAGGAASTLAGNKAGAYGSKVVLPDFKSNVNLPNYDPQAGNKDYAQALPLLNTIARGVTKANVRNRDIITGGESSKNLNQEGTDINSLLHGTVAADVQGNVNRMVAERSGGAFSPTGQAGQSASDDFARSIGKTSADMMTEGLTMAPQWESLVDAFTYKPQDAANMALNMLRARNDYTVQAGTLQNKIDEDSYVGKVNKAKAQAMPDPQVSGFLNDSLQLQGAQNQSNSNQINALLGAFKGVSGLFAGGGSGGSNGLNDAGFYTSAGAAATAAKGAPIDTYYGPGSTTPQYYISG